MRKTWNGMEYEKHGMEYEKYGMEYLKYATECMIVKLYILNT